MAGQRFQRQCRAHKARRHERLHQRTGRVRLLHQPGAGECSGTLDRVPGDGASHRNERLPNDSACDGPDQRDTAGNSRPLVWSDAVCCRILPDGAYALPPGLIAGVASRQAKPGETMVLYGVGFGPAKTIADQSTIPAGHIVMDLNQITAPVTISFGATRAAVSYAGLATTFVGLYQFNVTVPDVSDGDSVPITITLNGAPVAQTLYTAVRR